VTLRARLGDVRARWVTLRARGVTLRARWVTLRARWVTLRARGVTTSRALEHTLAGGGNGTNPEDAELPSRVCPRACAVEGSMDDFLLRQWSDGRTYGAVSVARRPAAHQPSRVSPGSDLGALERRAASTGDTQPRTAMKKLRIVITGFGTAQTDNGP
jgi:hypothetical protein